MPTGKTRFSNIKDKKIAVYSSKREDGSTFNPETITPVFPYKIWAAYRSLSGDEFYQSHLMGYEEECLFTVNWNAAIRPGMRIVFRDKVYKITRVDDLEGYKKDLKLTCEKMFAESPDRYPPV